MENPDKAEKLRFLIAVFNRGFNEGGNLWTQSSIEKTGLSFDELASVFENWQRLGFIDIDQDKRTVRVIKPIKVIAEEQR